MLRKFRITAALLCFVLITALFLDFTGTVNAWAGWLAKIQLVPAVLALHAGVIVGLVVLTLLLGRVYCSVICPLGVLQDLAAWVSRKFQRKKRYAYSPALNGLRYALLAVFVAAVLAGVAPLVALLDPYGAFGRMASNFAGPVYLKANNLLAGYAQRSGSYAFHEMEIWLRSAAVFGVALVSFLGIGFLAWRNGRTYCNTLCPVGTALGFLSRFAWLKPVIDLSKCNGCRQCERACKASCIDSREHQVDASRCVACMNCVAVCRQGAIRYSHGSNQDAVNSQSSSR